MKSGRNITPLLSAKRVDRRKGLALGIRALECQIHRTHTHRPSTMANASKNGEHSTRLKFHGSVIQIDVEATLRG